MFKLSNQAFSERYYNKARKGQSNKYFCLDCHSGEGQINQLLQQLNKDFILKKIPNQQKKKEFDFYVDFFF